MANFKKDDLLELIKGVFEIKEITPLINKQINNFIISYNMNYKDIGRCIVYYTEVLNQKMEIQYGIGIVPNIKEKALNYFAQLKKDQEKQNIEAKKIVQYQNNNIIFNINETHNIKRQVPQLGFDDIDLGDYNEQQ